MLDARQIRRWSFVHKWTSLICTAFLLLLCVTGLPLIFHHEIDHLLGDAIEPPSLPAGTPFASLDRIIAAGKAKYPSEVVQYVVWEKDDPNLMYVWQAASTSTPSEDARLISVDARTAEILGEPNTKSSFTSIMLRLHVDMFAGLPGKLFLGAMGLLFATAVVSGVVLYAPFMRKLPFGTVRAGRSRRLRWLDLHNLLGVVTVAWALVVGVTGSINTLADVVLNVWRADQLAEMIAPYKNSAPPRALVSLDAAVQTARQAAPRMTPSFIAFPGTPFTSNHHFAVFMRGETPITGRLLKPALIDAETGALTDMRELPWYVKTLLVSQPLHFGDYGGMGLKIIWALLDLVTIVVLASGLYLWLVRGSPMEEPTRQATSSRVGVPGE